MTFKKLFQPVRIGSLELKNRYVMNAMHLGFEKDSFVGKRTVDFYRERAKGGAGLIIAGGFKIEQIGYGPTFLSIADDDYLPGLRELTGEVKKEGATIFAQLMHAGRYVHSSQIGQQAVSASAVRSRLTGEEPRSLSIDEIKKLIDKYAETAQRAKNAGFDGVEVIASTGYLLAQFLSPLTNKRDDEYGGELSNRMRFGLEIAQAVRKAAGSEFPLIFRVSGNDFMKGGNTNSEAVIFAKELEHSGVDAINVQSGWHEAGVPTVQQVVPPGAFVYLAAAVKEEVSCPVMTCNKLGDPYLAEEVLLLRQLNMTILCGINNLWMSEVTTNMCRPFDKSPHK
jgi:2,4-dienoyl-CoA reductase (NADPH2)